MINIQNFIAKYVTLRNQSMFNEDVENNTEKLRILEASEVGHGILVETDAGWVSPKDARNAEFLKESATLDYRNPFEFF